MVQRHVQYEADASTHTPSQKVSAPEASSYAALVVPAGHATHAFSNTLSLAAQRIAVAQAMKEQQMCIIIATAMLGMRHITWVPIDRMEMLHDICILIAAAPFLGPKCPNEEFQCKTVTANRHELPVNNLRTFRQTANRRQ